jgi:hypothetical protein
MLVLHAGNHERWVISHAHTHAQQHITDTSPRSGMLSSHAGSQRRGSYHTHKHTSIHTDAHTHIQTHTQNTGTLPRSGMHSPHTGVHERGFTSHNILARYQDLECTAYIQGE